MSARRRGSNASNDTDFRPDRALADGEVVAGAGWTLEAVTTPGHTANHMAFALQGGQSAVLGRSRDGVVDAGGGAARRLDERLHGLARQARAPLRADLSARAMAARCATRRASCSTTSGTARRAKPRSCTGSARARPTFRPWCGRSISGSIRGWCQAAGRSVLAHLEDLVGARRGRHRRRALDRGRLPFGADARSIPSLFAFALPSSILFRRPAAAAPAASGFCARDRVVDVVHQAADARRIGAEIERAVARGGAHVDARAVAVGPHAHHDVVAKAHDRRARHRLDAAFAARRPAARARRRSRHRRLVITAQRRVIGGLRRCIRRRAGRCPDRPCAAARRHRVPHRRPDWRRAGARAPAPRSAADRSDRW